ncbi:hypothetical protein, partial [Neisseria gonorrhoeae]|uniref:hypothetical protein n=1 Tax=Neisseria gonorrhoeae TaxID=485 RepID=UPI002805117C
ENRKQRRKLKIPSFPRRRESGISMPQEFIGKNQNPSAVIPAQMEIWKFKITGIYPEYSGLTKIRTRRRAADNTDGTEPIHS